MLLEARQLASAAFVDVDDMVKYDWYVTALQVHQYDTDCNHVDSGLCLAFERKF